MDHTSHLATLVLVGSNQKVYMPPKKEFFQRYVRKFSKHGKLLEADLDDLGLALGDAPAPEAPAPEAAA